MQRVRAERRRTSGIGNCRVAHQKCRTQPQEQRILRPMVFTCRTSVRSFAAVDPSGEFRPFSLRIDLKLYFYRVFFSRTPRVITLFSFPAIEQLSNYPRKSKSSRRVGKKKNRRERSTNYKFRRSFGVGVERLSHRNNKRENCESAYTALGATKSRFHRIKDTE